MEAHSPSAVCGWDVRQVATSGGRDAHPRMVLGARWRAPVQAPEARAAGGAAMTTHQPLTGDDLLAAAGIDPETTRQRQRLKRRHTIHRPLEDRVQRLREQAAVIREVHTSPVERIAAMREAACSLELRIRDDELRTLLWQARNGEEGPVQPLTPADRLNLAPAPWLWEGVVLAEALEPAGGPAEDRQDRPGVGLARRLGQRATHLPGSAPAAWPLPARADRRHRSARVRLGPDARSLPPAARWPSPPVHRWPVHRRTAAAP